MPAIAATVRFWAGARRAAGHAEELTGARTLGELRAELAARTELARVAGSATYLVDGKASSDDTELFPGAVVDVLPPFAGG